jgi:hypothetical protein
VITTLCEDPEDEMVLGDQVAQIAEILQQRGRRHKYPVIDFLRLAQEMTASSKMAAGKLLADLSGDFPTKAKDDRDELSNSHWRDCFQSAANKSPVGERTCLEVLPRVVWRVFKQLTDQREFAEVPAWRGVLKHLANRSSPNEATRAELFCLMLAKVRKGKGKIDSYSIIVDSHLRTVQDICKKAGVPAVNPNSVLAVYDADFNEISMQKEQKTAGAERLAARTEQKNKPQEDPEAPAMSEEDVDELFTNTGLKSSWAGARSCPPAPSFCASAGTVSSSSSQSVSSSSSSVAGSSPPPPFRPDSTPHRRGKGGGSHFWGPGVPKLRNPPAPPPGAPWVKFFVGGFSR